MGGCFGHTRCFELNRAVDIAGLGSVHGTTQSKYLLGFLLGRLRFEYSFLGNDLDFRELVFFERQDSAFLHAPVVS